MGKAGTKSFMVIHGHLAAQARNPGVFQVKIFLHSLQSAPITFLHLWGHFFLGHYLSSLDATKSHYPLICQWPVPPQLDISFCLSYSDFNTLGLKIQVLSPISRNPDSPAFLWPSCKPRHTSKSLANFSTALRTHLLPHCAHPEGGSASHAPPLLTAPSQPTSLPGLGFLITTLTN